MKVEYYRDPTITGRIDDIKLEAVPTADGEQNRRCRHVGRRLPAPWEGLTGAAAVGQPLIAIRLREQDGPLDRPAIFLQRRGVHAHDVVIRPVGPFGSMVQIIDPKREPFVIDSDQMFASESWTGLALIPERTDWKSRLAGGVALILAVPIVAMLLKARRRFDPGRRRA